LTFELVGKHVNVAGAPTVYWQDFVLEEGTAELTLDSGSLSAKVGRPMQTTLSGGWDGLRYDDLIGAELTAAELVREGKSCDDEDVRGLFFDHVLQYGFELHESPPALV
jgi:hypothetical protein